MFFFHLSMDGFNNYNSIIDDDPIANTKANNVIKLSEISKNCMKIKVPTNDTGTAIAGIIVDRQSRKRNTTNPTKIKASIKV
jgi:hypothetical protein